MIKIFDRYAQENPDKVFFRFRDYDAAGNLAGEEVTYAQARLRAAVILRKLNQKGYVQGTVVACDMENCPAFVYLFLACIYGGITLVTLNHRLTQDEKAQRIMDASLWCKVPYIYVVTEDQVDAFVKKSAGEDPLKLVHEAQRAMAVVSAYSQGVVMFTSGTTGKAKAARLTGQNLAGSARACNAAFGADEHTLWQACLPMYHVGGLQIVVRSLVNCNSFILYRKFKAPQVLADAHRYGATCISVVDKTLRELLQESIRCEEEYEAACAQLAKGGEEAAANAERASVAEDASVVRASNGNADEQVGVLDSSCSADFAEEALALDGGNASSDEALRLPYPHARQYKVMMLGGAKPNAATLQAAVLLGAKVYSGYGMTETSSAIMYSLVAGENDEQLSLMPGYEARLVGVDAAGEGQLAIKGPGVFDGYLGTSTSFTADGFFLTGDRARIKDNRIVISERVEDMFVSGGENVYPEEIRSKILSVPGVTDAFVYGAPDAEWGRRPVAVVEMANTEVSGVNAVALAREIRSSLSQRLARIYMPDRIFVMKNFDRVGIGKTDRKTLRARAERAVNVKQVDVYRIALPMQHPIRTAKTVMDSRQSLVVKVTDAAGRTGIGECVAFETPWYLPETLDACWEYLEKQVIPCVLKEAFFQPDEAFGAFSQLPGAKEHPMAIAAMEPALWDLYGRTVGAPLTALIGANKNWDPKSAALGGYADGLVPGGVVLGIAPVQETLAAAKLAVDRGYKRIKLKIAPGNDILQATAIRQAFPDVMLLLDANQSYTEADEALLRRLDSLDCACIEEPLNPHYVPSVGPKEIYPRLARLQQRMRTPIALDESWVTVDNAMEALKYPDIRCLVLKAAKCGGVLPAVELFWQAKARGVQVWMGGMYDTGISKRLHGALSLLPGIAIPGDISDTSYYFENDITDPPFVLNRGLLCVNPCGFEAGLGCQLNEEALARVTVEHRVYQ